MDADPDRSMRSDRAVDDIRSFTDSAGCVNGYGGGWKQRAGIKHKGVKKMYRFREPTDRELNTEITRLESLLRLYKIDDDTKA